mmetsp:Transcript_19946/g.56233  ORF Transcript_19946/g.56233 Transcript_19946/m.56233 type:complete len:587 (-) Transcript_19946:78-1838(-)
MAPPSPSSARTPRLYTIGTWRVGRPAYLDQLKLLQVRKLIDVRGNPRAGRQEDLKRSKQLEAALASAGIAYEYWGSHLGEDSLEAEHRAGLVKACRQLAASAQAETLCLLGHLHEPQGCHRLQVCGELLKLVGSQGLSIKHLLWKDHLTVRQVDHGEVAEEAAAVLQFFNERWLRAEKLREGRAGPEAGEKLTIVAWKDFDPQMFSDGHARRFLLPFDTELLWYPHWLSQKSADELQAAVFGNVTFLHPTYVFQDPSGGFASTLIKRGQVRICGDDCPGALGAEPLQPWSEDLLRRVEDAAGTAFNCFVANHYANGRVVINWHSDSGPGDDEGLGPNPRIGSVSLGVTRTFSLKSKRAVDGRMVHLDVPLTHGSLLAMGRNSQTHWLHCLPADEHCRGERLNLTFRFFARQSTKHIEGVEHNHEWEAAPGSVRVLLHRGRCGRPVHVDIPGGVTARQLPRFLSTVLPGWRGHAEVSLRRAGQEWQPLQADVEVVEALQTLAGDAGTRPEVLVAGAGASGQAPDLAVGKGGKSCAPALGKGSHGQPSWSSGRWRPRGEGKGPDAACGRRWCRAGKGSGKAGATVAAT